MIDSCGDGSLEVEVFLTKLDREDAIYAGEGGGEDFLRG